MKSILVLIKDSSIVLFSIFAYVMFFAFAGYFIFKTDLEGYIYFITPAESFYQMFILLTTANFPDVMLPAYYSNRLYSLYFVGYLVIGLYFL